VKTKAIFFLVVLVLLISNLSVAQASLIGDRFDFQLNDQTPLTNVLVGEGSNEISTVLQPGISIIVNVEKEEIWLFYNQFGSPQLPLDVISHEIWFTDLDWLDDAGNIIDGKIVGITSQAGTNVPVVNLSSGDHEIHIEIGAFTINSPAEIEQAHFKLNVKHELNVVGGELIPLDSTMILVAGAQYNAAWMIPVIVSAIGIAIVIARKF